MNRIARIVAVLVVPLACEKPGVAPGLDLFTCSGGPCAAPGVIQGSVVYTGTARGDAILLLFDTAALPPPDGTGTSAVAVARVPAAQLFAGAAAGSVGPFSAPFTFTQVPSGRSYQIRAFIDSKGEFDPFFDFSQSPRAGEPAGGYGAIGSNGQPRLLAIDVAAGQVVSGISVALTQTLAYDPPAFEIVGPLQLQQNTDRPVRLSLRIAQLHVSGATFSQAHFGLELSPPAAIPALDGLPDVFPQVFLRQLQGVDANGNLVAVAASAAAIIPCRAIPTPVLPAILQLAPGATPVAQDHLDVLVEPLAVTASLTPLAQIPLGVYQVVVVEKSGQVWTVPNQLGDPAHSPTPFYASSQGASIAVVAGGSATGSIRGNVVYSGAAKAAGNIIVQAYLDDPANPPPPLGAARPVRVKIVRASEVTPTSTGFSAPYQIDGLAPGNYIVQGLADLDGNFGALSILMTPTKGDLTGAVIDPSTLLPRSIAVGSSQVSGQDVTLAQQEALDPPAFTIDAATPAQMPADQVTPVRFNLRATPLSFPVGQAKAPHFAVQLIRNSGGAAVDADHDGLPDVWPRVFLVRLDPSDPAGLTQYVSPDTHATATQVIPAAVDPTPFLPALQPQAVGNAPPVITDQLSIVARPLLLDLTNPAAPRRLPPQPGSYKIVLVTQSGQVWQIPNEAGSAALDPQVVCAASAATCPAGTVQTQSQSASFQVGLPAHPIYSGAIAGTLTAGTAPVSAYVFAFAANALPPFGKPVSADFHLGSEFVGGAVNFLLPDLPAGYYVVTAVADTRGDFAASPALFALAPGAGTLLASTTQTVLVGMAPVTVNLTAASAAPARPSFQLLDSSTGTLQTGDLSLSMAGTHSFQIKPKAVLTSAIAPLNPDTTGAFAIACDAAGAPVPSSLSVQAVKVGDPAGLSPQLDSGGNPVVVGATWGFSTATSCPAGTVVMVTSALTVTLTPPAMLLPGRYAVMVTSLAKQVWRLPNELQPLLADPGAVLATPAAVEALLQSQQAALNLTP